MPSGPDYDLLGPLSNEIMTPTQMGPPSGLARTVLIMLYLWQIYIWKSLSVALKLKGS